MERNDLLNKISGISKKDDNNDTKTNTSPSRKGRKVDVKVLKYEIDDEKDTELSAFIKQLINKEEITNKLVYDTFGRSEGWNMIYGLEKGSISWERVKKWCELMGYKVEITLSKAKTIEKK
jgi:hypothetical protein